MRTEYRRVIGDLVSLLPKRVDDDPPGVPVAWASYVSHVLKEHELWMARPDDFHNLEEQGPAGAILQPHLITRLRERLTREATA